MLFSGIFDLPVWALIVITLVLTHITIAAVTIFLHRHQTHKALTLHPIVSHFFRAWLWLTTGMVTKEWVAVHRKHHSKCETQEDPHSPQIHGIWAVVLGGVGLYRNETKNKETMEKYGHGTPDDWLERNLYSPHPLAGVLVMLSINIICFGLIPGFFMFVVQMLWIPFWAAGVINGVGHWWGYRPHKNVRDMSRNIFPWGVIVGGEELHNNHHANPSSAKLKSQWYEIDIGWTYIQLLSLVRLAKVVR
jgi:stearoyl-CoA desaturase (delta-9 desaturase)